jgi:4-hydroxy-2-oxovalerate aldolase
MDARYMKKIRIIDTTMRDGMHAVSHQFSIDDMVALAKGLEQAGLPAIEVNHGDGLGGSSFQYGFAKHTDEEYLKAVSRVLTNAKLTVLLLPGIGTIEDLKMAASYNAKIVRVATHVTEADVGIQHIQAAKKLGMEAIGFLMMSHMVGPEKIVEQAKIFADAGADMIYVTDSAGALTPDGVEARITAVRDEIGLPVGFHAHNNLGLAIGNTLKALECGVSSIDATCKGLGAAAGNCQTEVITAVLKKMGYETGIDLYKIMDVADDILVPKMHRPIVIDKNSLMIGYAGVYGSFLLHSLRAASKFNVDARDILYEMGQRKTVGGQEDMIINVAYDLANQRK